METVMAFAAEWWRLGLGIGGGVVVAALLWRWALEDLVLSSVELPSCERAGRTPQSIVHPTGNLPG
jgi:hypothetical protein